MPPGFRSDGIRQEYEPGERALSSAAYAYRVCRCISGPDQVIDGSSGTPLNQEVKYAPEVSAPTVHLSAHTCHVHAFPLPPREVM